MDSTEHRRVFVVAVTVLGLLAISVVPVAAQGSGSITGKVTDSQGTPLGGVCVILDNWGMPVAKTHTGADGTYRFDGVDRSWGALLVLFNSAWDNTPDCAWIPSFSTEWWRDSVTREGATPVDLAEEVHGIDAALGPSGALRGQVTDDHTGIPLEGIQVGVQPVDNQGTGGLITHTDADGSYRLQLPVASYFVSFIDKRNDASHIGEFYDNNGKFGPPGARVWPWSANPDLDHVVVTTDGISVANAALERGGFISGTTVAAYTGQPISDRPPVMMLWTSETQYGILLDVAGNFRTEPLPPGTFRVEFEYYNHQSVWWPDATSYDGAQDVVIQAGQTLRMDVAFPAATVDVSGCAYLTSSPFVDVVDGPHEKPIVCLLNYGIMKGRDQDHFDPASPIRRDQAAAVAARLLTALGAQVPTDAPDAFLDDNGDQFESSINALAALGVVRGTGDGQFDPAGTMTRGQTASLLVRARDAAAQPPLRSLKDVFTDDNGTVHEDAINKLAAAGIVAGTADGSYRPYEPIRRDQFATLVARTFVRIHFA